ncbi:MAG: anion transporter [Phycisphaerales bacterium]|nr:anion transporter [Phycisphaerales bacterium]
MDPLLIFVFLAVYLGMMLGRLPGVAIDRTGVALVGAVVLIAAGRMSLAEAWNAVDVPTVALLFGLMIVSVQFRLAGAYTAVTQRIAQADVSPQALLGLVIAVSAIMSALLANDVVCLVMAPLLVQGCRKRALNPMPMLLALACSANIGSAATLIGNPQNMLIGQSLHLSFAGYLVDGVPVALVGCIVLWLIIVRQYRGAWQGVEMRVDVESRELRGWQTAKGLIVLTLLVIVFVTGIVPRDVAALAAAAVLLISRRMQSREMLGRVDWQLLMLFIGLFVVNHAVARSDALTTSAQRLADAGIDVHQPPVLFFVTAVLSNLVSNVPAVMLLLPVSQHAMAGPVLALASTLAGNLIIVGSIANIIVVDQAARQGVRIGWWNHARTGIPVTLATLIIAAGWLWVRAHMM